MKDKIRIILYIMLISYLFSQYIYGASGDGLYFFTITDPAGDDHGPGTYQYPTDEDFRPGEGLFDITSFSIGKDGEDYLLEFQFEKLSDPWAGKFGFSHPLIQLYIDNEEGGSTELFREGANVILDQKHPWDHLLTISGWWVRSFTPEDKDRDDDFWNEDPWMLEDARVKIQGEKVVVRVQQSILGEMQDADIFLLVGGFDPFGPDYFRTITGKTANWNFADPEHKNLQFAPRVIDLISTEDKDQSAMLSKFNDSFPLVYPFRVSSSRLPDVNIILPVISLVILLLAALIFVYKKKPFRDNKE